MFVEKTHLVELSLIMKVSFQRTKEGAWGTFTHHNSYKFQHMLLLKEIPFRN